MLFKRRIFTTETYSFGPVFKTISRYMRFMGCAAYENPNPGIYALCYLYLMYILYGATVVLTLVNMIVEKGSIFHTQIAGVFFATFLALFKVTNFWLWRHRQFELKEFTVRNTSKLDNGNKYEQEVGLKYRKLINFSAEIVITADTIAYITYMMHPLLTKEHILPIHLKLLGISPDTYSGFYFTYFYGGIHIFYTLAAIIGSDVSFFSFTSYTAAQLELCAKYCKNIGDKSGIYNTDEKQRELIKLVAKLFSESYEFLTECSSLYGFNILMCAVCYVGLFCTCLVYLMVNTYPIPALGELFGIALQFLMYTVFGQLVLSKGEEISIAIYNSKWYELQDISDRKMVLFLLTSSNHGAGFSIGGFSILSLQSYTSFAKTCYAIAAFLLNVMGD